MYKLLAEVVFVFHVLVVIAGLLFPWLVLHFLELYVIGFVLGIGSWVFTQRCFLTDVEKFLRVKAGQIHYYSSHSFLGFWAEKIFEERTPSNKLIAGIIAIYYLLATPFLMYAVWIVYIQ